MKNIRASLKLIRLLSDGTFHPNEQVGEVLGINGISSIKKYIQIMQHWGIEVHTMTRPTQGYRLHAPLQLLDESEILGHLPREGTGYRLIVLSVIDSTNQYLMERTENLQPGDACVAEYQKKGRGRRGRQWVSPFGSNIYLSLYWRIAQEVELIGLSFMVSLVIADRLRQLGAQGIRVKWPNDLYVDDRKLAGILVEVISQEGSSSHIVIGVGINLTMRKSAAQRINRSWINLQEIGINIERNMLSASLIDVLRQSLWLFERNQGLTLPLPPAAVVGGNIRIS